MKLPLFPILFFGLTCHAALPDPQATDKRICVSEWSKTKADIDALLKRGLNMNANRIVEQCREFWTTSEQNSVAERVRLANQKGEAKARKQKGVQIGMTTEEVLQSSWGKPTQVNRTTNRNGTREQWVYGIRNYLYFDDGILTSIQN